MDASTILYRRWSLLGAGWAASLLPALLLACTFAQSGWFCSTFLAFWAEILAGPAKYWIPVFSGQPSPYGSHPMTGVTTWVYVVCLPMTFAHPIRPGLLTGFVTAMAFTVWYAWAFVSLAAYEFPC
jgi:ABC-type Mn2+/Zn2+ transport system permease subunit